MSPGDDAGGARAAATASGSAACGTARLVVTSRGFREGRAWKALKAALPAAWLEGSGFRGVLLVEAEGDPLALAARVARECAQAVGHVTPVLAEVPTDVDAIRGAATQIAAAHVGPGQSFCFRMHRRGWRLPAPEAAALERAIGGSIFDALERSRGAPPTVDLERPDLTIVAEVLGPRTLVGVAPRSTLASELERAPEAPQEG